MNQMHPRRQFSTVRIRNPFRNLGKILPIASVSIFVGCSHVNKTAVFNDRTVGTYSTLAGCGTLSLDEDCSEWSGPTRKIRMGEHKLRVAGGEKGRVIFVTALPLRSDEPGLTAGTVALEEFFSEHEIEILETNVMAGFDAVYGVQYKLNKDGYSLLKEMTIE